VGEGACDSGGSDEIRGGSPSKLKWTYFGYEKTVGWDELYRSHVTGKSGREWRLVRVRVRGKAAEGKNVNKRDFKSDFKRDFERDFKRDFERNFERDFERCTQRTIQRFRAREGEGGRGERMASFHLFL
jgi:hypothetical protein